MESPTSAMERVTNRSRMLSRRSGSNVRLQRPEPVKILCFTWNVGNAMPRELELEHWLKAHEVADLDLVVVGTQENSVRERGLGIRGSSAKVPSGTAGAHGDGGVSPAESGDDSEVEGDVFWTMPPKYELSY